MAHALAKSSPVAVRVNGAERPNKRSIHLENPAAAASRLFVGPKPTKDPAATMIIDETLTSRNEHKLKP